MDLDPCVTWRPRTQPVAWGPPSSLVSVCVNSPSRPPEQIAGRLARRLPNFRGKTRIAWSWKKALERRRGGPLAGDWPIELTDGHRYVLPAGASMTWALAWTGRWDDHVRDHILGLVRPGGLILDVGASLGLWTVPLGRWALAMDSHVWAFEPYPLNLPFLRGNVDRNGLCDVVSVQPIALGSEATEVRMPYAEAGGGNAAIVLGAKTGPTVPVVRLDDLDLLEPVRFMKMDCEGYEIDVLSGGRQLIERDRPVIFGEFSHEWLAIREQDPRELLNWLASLDYEIYAVERLRRSPWATRTLVRTRRLRPPFGQVPTDLLLVPTSLGQACRAPSSRRARGLCRTSIPAPSPDEYDARADVDVAPSPIGRVGRCLQTDRQGEARPVGE